MQPQHSPSLSCLTFKDLAEILALQHKVHLTEEHPSEFFSFLESFDSAEKMLWHCINGLAPAALAELCALIWKGRDDSDDASAWSSMVLEARGIAPYYVFEKLANHHSVHNGLKRTGLDQAFAAEFEDKRNRPVSIDALIHTRMAV